MRNTKQNFKGAIHPSPEVLGFLASMDKKFWITDSQYQILRKFRDKFRAFSDGHSYEPLFIDTPEWSEITEMAKEVLKAFHYPEVQKTESP
jgi:hypothetical protein